MAKFTNEELNGVKVRESLLQAKQIEFSLLSNEKDIYVTGILEKYKLDPKAKYTIAEDGEILISTEKK